MPNEYDKVIRENLEAVVLPLLHKLLGIQPRELKELPGELQVTIERKPDMLKKVVNQVGKVSIVHIEF